MLMHLGAPGAELVLGALFAEMGWGAVHKRLWFPRGKQPVLQINTEAIKV